jgi:hypothetical protein
MPFKLIIFNDNCEEQRIGGPALIHEYSGEYPLFCTTEFSYIVYTFDMY